MDNNLVSNVIYGDLVEEDIHLKNVEHLQKMATIIQSAHILIEILNMSPKYDESHNMRKHLSKLANNVYDDNKDLSERTHAQNIKKELAKNT